MNARILLTAAALAAMCVASASAQVNHTGFGPYATHYGNHAGSSPGAAPGIAYDGYGGTYALGGGTAAGNHLQGQAAIIQSQGQYNYLTATAAKEAEDARLKMLDNKSAHVRNYFELRRFNDERRAAERPPQATREQLARLATIGVPKRPAAHQLDQQTGIILWPDTLAGDEFAEQRAALEKLYGERVSGNHGVGSELYQGVTSSVADMKAILKAQIHAMDPTEYLAARKFLDSLGYEARFAPQGNVAAR